VSDANAQIFSSFKTQFLPYFRFHNPKLEWSALKQTEDIETGRNFVEMKFHDNGAEKIETTEIKQSHDLAELILKIDNDKHIFKENYVNRKS
jgi:hypothetical protein